MILITGLTGTSGSAFYDILVRENYSEKIRVLVRETSDISMFKDCPLDLELVFGNLNDKETLLNAMAGCDTVFHIAAKDKIRKVADSILSTPSIKKVIFVSSTIVYSKHYPNSTLRTDEPIVRKALFEKGIRCVFLRPTMIFGTPNDQNISQFIRWFGKYPIFPIVKKGVATISPISRLDVAEAYWKTLNNFDKLKKDEYIVSGNECMSLYEMFKILVELQGKKTKFINIPFPFANACVLLVYLLSFKKIDYREKLNRLTEDRAYPNDIFKVELGFNPKPFSERVLPLIKQINNIEKSQSS